LRRLPTAQPQHLIAAGVALGTIGLALANTSAPAPRETYTLAGLVVWTVVILGTVAGVFPRAPVPRAAIVAGGLLAGFTALTALSVFWASDQGNAFDQIARASAYTGLFVLVAVAARDGEGGWWLRGLAIGLAGVAILALAPRLAPDVFGTPDADLGAEGRLGYPINYWNGLGAMMAAGLALLAWLSTQAQTRAGRTLATAAVPLPLLALYMAQSRGGALAMIAALGVLVAVGPARERLVANLALGGALALPLIAYASARTAFLDEPGTELAAGQGGEVLAFLVATVVVTALVRRRLDARLQRFELTRTQQRAVLWGTAIVALLALVAFDPAQRFDEFKQPPTAEQLESDVEGGLLTRSGGGRWQFWDTALEAFADEPAHGIGAGEFGTYWSQHGSFGFPTSNAHSLFLESFAELGILGFLLIAGFFGGAVVAGGVRSSYVRDGAATAALAVVAAGTVSAAFDFVWELPAVLAPAILVAALLTGNALTPTLINAPPPPPVPLRRSRTGLALAAAMLAFGWAAMVASGLLLLTERALDRSRDAVTAADYREAISAAEDAVDLMPWSAEPRVQLGLAYQRAGDYDSARDAFRAAIDRADENWRLWRALALVDGISGEIGAACRDVDRAQALNPREPRLFKRIEGLDCPGPEPEPLPPET
jgi:tetratricopeptide (TPR) repeat protein